MSEFYVISAEEYLDDSLPKINSNFAALQKNFYDADDELPDNPVEGQHVWHEGKWKTRTGDAWVVDDANFIHNNVAAEINALTTKETLVDDDVFLAENSESTEPAFQKVKVTFQKLKASLKTYFDTLYNSGGGGWERVSADAFTATPASTSTLTMLEDLTDKIQDGDSLRWVQNAVEYFAQVQAITSELLTIRGAPFSLSYDVEDLQFGGGKLSQINLQMQLSVWDETALLVNENDAPLFWDKKPAYALFFRAWNKLCSTMDTKGYVNVMIDGNPLCSANSDKGLELAANATSYLTGVNIKTANYAIGKGKPIDVAYTAGFTVSNSSKLAGLGEQTPVAPYNSSNCNWGSVTNIYTDNASYASVTHADFDTDRYTSILKASSFGHQIPAEAVVLGIEVKVDRKGANGQAVDALIQLSKDKTSGVGNNKADTSTPWESSDTLKTYGANNDLWGTTWTPAEINSANFSVFIAAKATQNDADVFVDYVRTIVYYKMPDDAEILCVDIVALTP